MPDTEVLQSLSLDEIRSRRAEYMSAETGMSYLRRMVQGPLDIVRREQELRADGEVGDLASLVEDLPEVLADGPRAAGNGRLQHELEPHQIDAALEAELQAITAKLVDVAHVSDPALVSVAIELEAFERQISDRRHDLHIQIDTLQAELTRRYRTGEASVDSLLN